MSIRWNLLVIALLAPLVIGCGDDSDPASATAGADTAEADADEADTSAVDSAITDTAGASGGGDTASSADSRDAPDAGASDTSVADTAGSDSAEPADSMSDDPCPAPLGGITWGGKRRFMHGINYAWSDFAADFGGIAQWNQPGVAAALDVHRAALADMKDHGVGVARWWVWPDLRGDSIVVDDTETPTGLGGTTLADLNAALTLAEETDTYLMLCLFSFDGFRPSRDISGLWTPGLTDIVTDSAKRQALLEQVVRPFAQAAAAHPNADRLISWDLINEPEWAMTGPGLYGADPDFEQESDLVALTHSEMELFLSELAAVLRAETNALLTVGATAMKWRSAWSQLDLDFDQFHVYDWINVWWPYDNSPSSYGLNDRPVVMGEFPLSGLIDADYASMLPALWSAGYAGAMGWQYNQATPAQLDAASAFSAQHSCETAY